MQLAAFYTVAIEKKKVHRANFGFCFRCTMSSALNYEAKSSPSIGAKGTFPRVPSVGCCPGLKGFLSRCLSRFYCWAFFRESLRPTQGKLSRQSNHQSQPLRSTGSSRSLWLTSQPVLRGSLFRPAPFHSMFSFILSS